MALQKSSLTLPKLVSHSRFSQRLTLQAVISECGKTSVTSLNSAQLQITDLSSSEENIFFLWCVFSPTTPLENYHSAAEPTGHEQPELCQLEQLPAGCLELCRKVLAGIQQHLHPTMLTVSGCPVGTPRNYI